MVSYLLFVRDSKFGAWVHDITVSDDDAFNARECAYTEKECLSWRYKYVKIVRLPKNQHEHEFITAWLAKNN